MNARNRVSRGRDLFDPWIDGHEARKTEISRSANPYRGTDARQLWDDGWMDAHRELQFNSSPASFSSSPTSSSSPASSESGRSPRRCPSDARR
jgi:ribosome modulation factor